MPLPHTSVDKLHAVAVEACLAYERACRRRGMKLRKLTITYEPDREGFDLKVDEVPYPRHNGKPIIPVEERELSGEEVPLPPEKD